MTTNFISLVVAMVFGALFALGFAPYQLPFLSLSAVSALLFLLMVSPNRLLSYCFGLGVFGAGAYWFYVSLHFFGDAVELVAAAATAVFIMILAAFYALFGFLFYRLIPAQWRWWTPWSIAGLWVSVEFFRAWLFGGFPWLSLGYALIDTPLAPLAPLGGVYALSFVGVLLAAYVTMFLLARSRAKLLLTLSLAVIGIFSLKLLPQWVVPNGETIKVAAIQPNIAQHQKRLLSQINPSIELLTNLSVPLAGEVDLILWPESAVPTLLSRVEDALAPTAEYLAQQGSFLISGLFTVDQDQRAYNTLLNLNDYSQAYRKRRLVPFGETIPMREWLAPIALRYNIPLGDLFPSKDEPQVFNAGSLSLGAFICYEAAFGQDLIAIAEDVELWLNVSNDAWFGDTSAPHQHLQITRMRALETGRPILRSSNTGISAVIDSQGKVVSSLGVNQEGVVQAELALQSGRTPFVRWGNWPIFVLSFSLLGFSLISRSISTRRLRRANEMK